MKLADLRTLYDGTITLVECADEDCIPDTVETGSVIQGALGVGIFELEDGNFVVPYFSSDSNEGLEVFDLDMAEKLSPEIAEQIRQSLYQNIEYYQGILAKLDSLVASS